MSRNSVKVTLIAIGGLLFAFSIAVYITIRNPQESKTNGLVKTAEEAGEETEKGVTNSGRFPEVKEPLKAKKTAEVKSSEKAPRAPKKEPPSLIEKASQALDDTNIMTRMEAIYSLRENPSREAVEILSRFLLDKDRVVVREAIDALGVIGLYSEFGEFAYNILEEKARDKDFAARGQALVNAAMFGPSNRILPLISQYINEEDERAKIAAVSALSFVAIPESIPHLESLLECEDAIVQRNALNILAKINTGEAVELIEKHLHSSDEFTQFQAVWALSVQKSEEFNGMLIDAMVNKDLKDDAISTIASSPAAADVIGKVLQRDDIMKEDRIAWLNVIAEQTRYAPGSVRDDLVSALEPMLDSGDPEVAIAALKAIRESGGTGEETAEKVASTLKSESFLVQEEALKTFLPYCSPNTYKSLIDLWWDEDQKISRTSFLFSSMYLNRSDINALEEAKNHEDEFIRDQAGIVLQNMPQSTGEGS